MRLKINASQCAGFLLAAVLLAGCATPTRRERSFEQLDPSNVTNLTAFLGTTNLEIGYSFHGKEIYAHATWPGHDGDAPDFQYRYRYSYLAFDHEHRATRKSVLKHGEQLTIRGPKDWRTLVTGVFQGLTPAQPGHGVLVLVQGEEIAVYRDKNALPHTVHLEEKPADLIVDHAFSQSDFTREAIRLLEKNATLMESNKTQFLFVTDDDPAFVLLDLRDRMIVFLSYPEDPKLQPTDLPGWFTLRAFHSIIIRGFLVSALKNPVTTVTRGLWHIGSSGAAALDYGFGNESTNAPPLYHGPGMDLDGWEKDLDAVVASRRGKGKLDLLIDGENFFPAVIKAIENAHRSIDVMVYIFSADEYAVTIADILKHRSEAVRVRVLMDDLGSLFGRGEAPPSATPPSFKYPGDIKSYLKADSKVAVRASTNPWLTSDHRKCIIVDDRQAFVGGMNIGWEYRYDWHDMMVSVTGPVVGRLEKDYEEAWAHASLLGDFAYAWVSLFDRTHPRRNELPDAIDVRPLRTATGHLEIYRAQLEAIRHAKGYIYIENAYFSDYAIVRELIRARMRGVDVRVVLPSKNDSPVMHTSNLIMANAMISHGIRVYFYPGMTHVKAAIYDGWACLGSANMEKMSLRVSQELDLGFSDPATVNRLKEELFEKDFKRSREIKEPVRMNWVDSFVKAFADQI